MSSPPYTVTKLVRWRVKDWVSCFNACKLPLEEESEATNPVKTGGESKKIKIVKSKIRFHQKGKKEVESSSPSKRVAVANKKEMGDVSSKWPSFADDDYIVFCFKENGEVQVLPEKKSNPDGSSTSSSSSANANSKRLNLQLLRLEDEAERNEEFSNGKGKEKEGDICSSDEIQEITEEEEEGIEISAGSSDSNDQSDAASASSFAFPIIQGEWIGSPVQMPRPAQERKSKTTRISCCRF